PPWAPLHHASVRVIKNTFEDYDEQQNVYHYVAQLRAHQPRDWDWDAEQKVVFHTGLDIGETLVFGIDDNPIVNGWPSNYTTEDKYQWTPPDDALPFNSLSREERARIEAARKRREYIAVDKRLRRRGDAELIQALDILRKRVDEPGLWEDLRTLFREAGPIDGDRDDDDVGF
ncbi:MAG: hypothetical protein AAGD23_08430, partial [Pseudomonadota bacterium]